MSVAKNCRERRFELDMRNAGYQAVRVDDRFPIAYDSIAVHVPNAEDIPKVRAATALPTLVSNAWNFVGLSHHKPLPKFIWKKKKIWLCKPAKDAS